MRASGWDFGPRYRCAEFHLPTFPTPAYTSGNVINRNFCGDCGSALFSDPVAFPGVRFLKLGALDDPKDIKLVAEIYVDDALSFQAR